MGRVPMHIVGEENEKQPRRPGMDKQAAVYPCNGMPFGHEGVKCGPLLLQCGHASNTPRFVRKSPTRNMTSCGVPLVWNTGTNAPIGAENRLAVARHWGQK